MMELRKHPRTNVVWRAVIQLDDENIVPAKVMNIARGGLLVHCAGNVVQHQEYRLMMEVPSIDQFSSHRYQVHCKMRVVQSVLSGDYYHANMQFTELSDLHQNLYEAWLSITTRHDQLV